MIFVMWMATISSVAFACRGVFFVVKRRWGKLWVPTTLMILTGILATYL